MPEYNQRFESETQPYYIDRILDYQNNNYSNKIINDGSTGPIVWKHQMSESCMTCDRVDHACDCGDDHGQDQDFIASDYRPSSREIRRGRRQEAAHAREWVDTTVGFEPSRVPGGEGEWAVQPEVAAGRPFRSWVRTEQVVFKFASAALAVPSTWLLGLQMSHMHAHAAVSYGSLGMGMFGLTVSAALAITAASENARLSSTVASVEALTSAVPGQVPLSKKARKAVLADLRARQERVELAYGEFETNLLEVFHRPLLADVRVAETGAFHTARKDADSAWRLMSRDVDAGLLSRYEAAVRALETAWDVAYTHASEVGLGHLSEAERKKVNRASGLLAIILDGGLEDKARQEHYNRVLELVKDLVVLPQRARLALESRVRLAISGGSEPGSQTR